MLAKAVFATAFLLPIGITLAFPSLPPAQLLIEFLKIPQTTLSIGGISIATLLNGITNGFIWLLIAATIYGLSLYSKTDPLPPMPVAPDLPSPLPEPMPVDIRINKIPPSFTVGKRIVELDQGIETINGIGPVYGESLRNSGIQTVNDLVRVGATKRGRQRLARKIGVTDETLLKWVNRGDLLRVNGIGKKYSTLLESAGVNTVTDLSGRNPRFLYQTLKTVNREKNLVRRTPPSKTIEIWVNNAKKLEPIVSL
jgi:predicted flap endonuclease-1-like 5' DNA nuclease